MQKIIPILICITLFACQQIEHLTKPINSAKLISVSAPQNAIAGQPIEINVHQAIEPITLIITSALGSQIIEPLLNEHQELSYRLPSHIIQKSGVIDWTIIDAFSTTTGKINIKPMSSTNDIEVYIGPTTMTAGTSESAMTSVILTDKYDNVLPNGSNATITSTHHSTILSQPTTTHDGIAFIYHNAPKKAGNAFTSVKSGGTVSEEYTYQINASTAQSIGISADQQHTYADGSTTLIISTNLIKDQYGNVIENGTLINFIAEDRQGRISSAQGYTVGGIATGVFVHPESETTWSIYASVSGKSSNRLLLEYDTAVKNLPLDLSQDGQLIVGPLTSYIDQLIPDGMPIHIDIYRDQEHIYSRTSYTKKGIIDFNLNNVMTHPLDDAISVTVTGAGLSDSITYQYKANDID